VYFPPTKKKGIVASDENGTSERAATSGLAGCLQKGRNPGVEKKLLIGSILLVVLRTGFKVLPLDVRFCTN
jgi:hypothetical protein